MTWPEAFAAVGIAFAFAAVIWAMCWSDRPPAPRPVPPKLNTTPCGSCQFTHTKTKATKRHYK